MLKLDDLVPAHSGSGMHTVRDILIDKHPVGQPPAPLSLIGGTPDPVDLIIFDQLTASAIKQAAMHMQGSGGPSGLDAYAWRWFVVHLGLPLTTYAPP